MRLAPKARVGNFLTANQLAWRMILNEQPALTNTSDAGINVQIREYLDLVLRRKLWIVLLTLGVTLCVGVVAFRLPNVYRAETTILVNPQKVNENYVSTTVSGSIADRLSTVRQEVMSPTQLGRLVDELQMYPNLRGKASTQALVGRMQNFTSIEVQDSGSQRLSTFRIAFTDLDPRQAARVANRIASLFIDRNIKARELKINGTSQFLETELEETRKQLELKEHTLQDIKARYIMDLPESKQYHLEAMNALRDQLRLSQERVDRDRQTKVYLQSMAGIVAPTIDLDQQSQSSTSPSQARLQKLEAQMKDTLVRYGPNYPDVIKLRNEISKLKAKAESEKSLVDAPEVQPSTPVRQGHNPVVEAEANKLDQDIEEQTKAQAELEKQIQYHVGKLQQVPVFEQQIAGLMRDYDSLRNHYSQLQEKKLSAQMAGELESQSAGERFEVLDVAVPPEGPYGPKRTLMIVGGLLMGLLCGVGVAMIVDIADESVRTEREAAQIFGKPVLAGIPRITSVRERIRSRWRLASLTAGTAAAAVLIGMTISRFVV
jgi:polysaccharide chain length determinant protein (PEP-CTERM system associated)